MQEQKISNTDSDIASDIEQQMTKLSTQYVHDQAPLTQLHAMQSHWRFWYFHRQVMMPDESVDDSRISQVQDSIDQPSDKVSSSANQQLNNDTSRATERNTSAQARSASAARRGQSLERAPRELKKQVSVTYRQQLKELALITSVEYFFNFYVHMKRPSQLPRDIDLFFFRSDETPMWEDSVHGGCWILKLNNVIHNIDYIWEQILFCLIGEQFDEPQVIGVNLSLRNKENLLQLWLKDGRNEAVKTQVSNKLRHFLELNPHKLTLYYKEHRMSMQDQSTMKNAEGFVFMTNKSSQKNGVKISRIDLQEENGFYDRRLSGPVQTSHNSSRQRSNSRRKPVHDNEGDQLKKRNSAPWSHLAATNPNYHQGAQPQGRNRKQSASSNHSINHNHNHNQNRRYKPRDQNKYPRDKATSSEIKFVYRVKNPAPAPAPDNRDSQRENEQQ